MGVPEQVVLERDAMMFELRKRGMTYEQIGKAMKVSTKTAHNGVQRMTERILKRMSVDYAGQAALDLERLDSMLANVWDLTKKRKIETPDGDQVELPPSMEAIDRVLKIMDRRAKLLGLDSNPSIDINVNNMQLAPAPGGVPEEATLNKDKKRETIELLRIAESIGVVDEAAVKAILSSIGEKDKEIVDADIVELEPIKELTGPPEWVEEDDSADWE